MSETDPLLLERTALGNRLLAYVLGLTATAQLRNPLSEAATERLEVLRAVLTPLLEVDAPQTIQAWLMGSGMPGGEAPARAIREEGAAAASEVHAAASRWLSGGYS